MDALARHPHAKAVLSAALPPGGSASHAYLFHGPAGAGKRAAARFFAGELLADGAPDPANARARVQHDSHPDLTWVKPSGAADMLVADIDEPVVAAVSRTPFEALRRVFVIERADTMNDQAANKMLKTLEEPPPFAHLVLLTDRPGNMLPTIASRCQLVRFEAPTVQELTDSLTARVPADQAAACARLALGDADRALTLAVGDGPALRAAGEAYARACVRGTIHTAPWLEILAVARRHGEAEKADCEGRVEADAEYLPTKDARRARREGETVAKRAERRARTAALDQAMVLAGLWLRDVACVLDGAPELVHHVDRLDAVREDAGEAGTTSGRLRDSMAMIEEARTMLMVNPTEELLLESLASRIARTVAR